MINDMNLNFQMVYVTRNPKDAAVSWYYHQKHLMGYTGPKEDFFEAFLADQVLYTPFLDHVVEYWKLRDEKNVLFLFFEDMKSNLRAIVRKTIDFFGKKYSDQQIDDLCNYLSFDSMKDNPACNKQHFVDYCKNVIDQPIITEKYSFMRSGKVGGHAAEFSDEIDKKFDEAFITHSSAVENGLKFGTKLAK